MENNAIQITRMEKAAHDSGFDIFLSRHGDWISFASSRCPIKIWLMSGVGGLIIAAFSDELVSGELASYGVEWLEILPGDAQAARFVTDFSSLDRLLKRAFQLSRALPSEPLREFQKQIVGRPQSTEVERIAIQRVGQDIFRERLIEFWDGKCAVTGLAIPALLKASHIKPWKDCATDAERLDVYNGLLLAPHFDALFDRGFISFGDDGALIASSHLGSDGLRILGIEGSAKVSGLTSSHLKYLAWHRAKEFRGI